MDFWAKNNTAGDEGIEMAASDYSSGLLILTTLSILEKDPLSYKEKEKKNH